VIFIVYLLFLLFGVLCASFLITGAKLVSDEVIIIRLMLTKKTILSSVETKLSFMVAHLSSCLCLRDRKDCGVFHPTERRKVWNLVVCKKFCDKNFGQIFREHFFGVHHSPHLFLAKHNITSQSTKKRKSKKTKTSYDWLEWK
jgi:hypothetical protein